MTQKTITKVELAADDLLAMVAQAFGSDICAPGAPTVKVDLEEENRELTLDFVTGDILVYDKGTEEEIYLDTVLLSD